MDPSLLIPKFENGEFLSESELYQLAWLPFELYRLSNVAKGHAGFFHPEMTADRSWNHFDYDNESLTIRKMFVISPQGVPFLLTRPRTLDLSDVTIDRTTLYASAYFAGNARALKDEHFVATLEVDAGEPGADFDITLLNGFTAPGDQSAERAPNAYQVLFHWGADTAPEIEGARRFSLELGKLEGSAGSAFAFSPTAYYPASLPELAEATAGFRETLARFTELLLAPTVAPGVERSTLLDRLDLLAGSLTAESTPTHQIIADVRPALASAMGFFLRVAYARNPHEPAYRALQGLEGRMLEHQLQLLFRGGNDDLSELIAGFVAHPPHTPETGQAQIAFFRGLETLFDAERAEAAVGDLQPPPEPERPRRREKPPPAEPFTIDLDKKGKAGE